MSDEVAEYRRAKKKVEKFVDTSTGDEYGKPIDQDILTTAMKDVVNALEREGSR